MTVIPDDDTTAFMQRALLDFFDGSARPLPWRSTRDPYAIWVSEVMSQQTRIETVLPYYARWIERFPDVDCLADADLDVVLKQWEGLGYYSRARNLHAAARIVRERHAGVVPTSYDELRALPGIGDYTAGAIASIAGGAGRPAVDGNVRRVLSRFFDLPRSTPAGLTALASALVPSERPGDFNQALMELGATICTPRSPRCTRCVLSLHCRALRNGTQLERPLPRPRRPIPTVPIATAVLVDEADRLLLVRRSSGLLNGLWSFPGDEVSEDDEAAATVTHIAARYAAPASAPRALAVIEHTFSHRRERYLAFVINVERMSLTGEDVAWVVGAAAGDLALPRAQQKILARVVTRDR